MGPLLFQHLFQTSRNVSRHGSQRVAVEVDLPFRQVETSTAGCEGIIPVETLEVLAGEWEGRGHAGSSACSSGKDMTVAVGKRPDLPTRFRGILLPARHYQ
ncbi:hypothetical protein D9M71_377240 [compost metagenome]